MKRALLVGINYVGTGNELRGCINDAHNMQALLTAHGFSDITLVLEKDATTAGIITALNALIQGVVPGDVIVFFYSGHGSQLPSNSEPDGFEEIICPIDLNWMDKVITDSTLRDVFNRVPNGVNTTVILDCCHAGTGVDQTEVFITVDVPGSKYLTPPPGIVTQLADTTLVDWQTSKDINASALLIAACHENQISADTVIDGMPQGAATSALIKSVNATPVISYKTLVTEMTDFMVTNKYSQRPELDGSSSLYDQIFLEPFSFAIAPSEPAVVTESSKSNTALFICVGLIILGIIIKFFIIS